MSDFQNNQYQAPVAPAAPVAPVAPQAPTLPQANAPAGNPVDQAKDMAQKVLKNKNLPMIAGIAVAVVVVILLASLLFGKGYEKPLDKYMDNFYKAKITESKLEDMMPKEAWEKVEEEFDEDAAEIRANAVENYLEYYEDDFNDYYGDFDKYDFEIKKVKELSERKVEDIAEYLDDVYDIDEDSVKKVYKLTLDGEIAFDDEEVDLDDRVYYSVKIGGKWYLLNSSGNFAAMSFLSYYDIED